MTESPVNLLGGLSDRAPNGPPLYRVQIEGKIGFVDRRGQVVIPARFDFASDFREGRATFFVVENKKLHCGLIDAGGRCLLEPEFSLIGPFSEGLARVTDESRKSGFIDKSGQFVIPRTFDACSSFHEGLLRGAGPV